MAGDVPVWPDNMALMTVKGGCLHILLKYPNAPARFVNKIEDCFQTMKTDLASYSPLLVIAPTGQFT